MEVIFVSVHVVYMFISKDTTGVCADKKAQLAHTVVCMYEGILKEKSYPDLAVSKQHNAF